MQAYMECVAHAVTYGATTSSLHMRPLPQVRPVSWHLAASPLLCLPFNNVFGFKVSSVVSEVCVVRTEKWDMCRRVVGP